MSKEEVKSTETIRDRLNSNLAESHRTIVQQIKMHLMLHRFYGMVFKSEGDCIVCISHIPKPTGYTQIKIGGSYIRLHRFVYEVIKGKIPDELYVLHKCTNRGCCNPNHLEVGTAQDNADDRVKDGNHYRLGSGRSELTQAQIADIRTKRIFQYEFAELYGVSRHVINTIQVNMRNCDRPRNLCKKERKNIL